MHLGFHVIQAKPTALGIDSTCHQQHLGLTASDIIWHQHHLALTASDTIWHQHHVRLTASGINIWHVSCCRVPAT